MPVTNRRIAIASNPKSEKAKITAQSISKMLTSLQVVHDVFADKWAAEWNDYTEVWIVGGDGTLNYFINQHPEIDLPLAIFRGGSGNDFHWVLYGEIAVDKQVVQVLEGKPYPVDAGRCNDRLFLNGIGIGFDGKVAKDIRLSRKRGKGMYLLTILKNILFFKSFQCNVTDEHQVLNQKCFMISVANGKRYGGGFHVTPAAEVNDGLFDVNVVGKIHPLKRIRYLPVIEKGEHRGLRFIKHFTTGHITIAVETNIPAHADGEYFSSNRFRIDCLPSRFRFIK